MRQPAALHHEAFQQAFIGWRMPVAGQPPANPAHVAKALERWLAEYPGDAALLQQFAAGAAAVATVAADWPTAWRLAQTGTDAAQIGALDAQKRRHLAALLALQAARAALELNDSAGARRMLELADESFLPGPAEEALTSCLRWLADLLAGELAESALEQAAAAEHFANALQAMQALESDPARLQALASAWVALLYGELPPGQLAQAAMQLAHVRDDARLRTVFGLTRASNKADDARRAVQLASTQGLPWQCPVLATQNLLRRLPAGEIDTAAQCLLAAAQTMDEPWRSHWQVALHAQQAEAWLERGDLARACLAAEQSLSHQGRRTDGISLCLAMAARVRVDLALADAEAVRAALDTLLAVRARTARILAGSPWQLMFRAACEPALQAGLQLDAQRLRDHADDLLARRSLSQLLDALRAPQEAALPDEPATDRLGRLAAALAADPSRADWRVLVLQAAGDATMQVCIGGDPAQPLLVTALSRPLADALRALTQRSAQALQAAVPDDELQALGCAAHATLPEAVRRRLQGAGTLIVVPDFSGGQDHAPVELLHDGDQFLGTRLVVSRCLSLAHALRAVEAPLVPMPTGNHALCIRVSQPPGWTPLQHAEAESRRVAEVLHDQRWDVVALAEAQADTQAVTELLPLAHLLHIACHGEATAGREALVLGGGGRLTALAFATRHPVRCVTYLNACSLARGRYLGGGVSRGVAHAFARSGAPAVLANLSPVEDDSAALLAEAFYMAASDLPVGQALLQARQLMQSLVGPARWSPTVLLGDPLARLGADYAALPDATRRLFTGQALPGAKQLAAARKHLAVHPQDLRLAAAIRFADARAKADTTQLESLAALAREIGHDIGEADCLVAWADALHGSAERELRAEVLDRALAALRPLRHAWGPAAEALVRLQGERNALDPTYQPRELKPVKLASGMSINDRSDPTTNLMLSYFEALHEHESFWRGEPELHQPDLNLVSVAHNAVVWGHMRQLFGSGAEAAYAEQCAQRLAWRGLVPLACAPDLGRVLAGLLHFLWGQQGYTHLEHWMQEAHTQVLLIAMRRLPSTWLTVPLSPAPAWARALGTQLDRMAPPTEGSKFARARAALRGGGPVAASASELAASIDALVRRHAQTDPMPAAEAGAWVLGELMLRIDAAERAGAETALAYRSLFDDLSQHEEGWFWPYLEEGFADMRATYGQDPFSRWSQSMR